MGTHGIGLQVFDPKTETWKSYGPEQGLPLRDVDEFFPIGGRFSTATENAPTIRSTWPTPAVTLVHRGNLWTREEDWTVGPTLLLAWRDGQKVVAIDGDGVWDNLLSNARKWTPLPDQTCYGWPAEAYPCKGILGVVEIGGRRLCVCRRGLYELDAAGKFKVFRAWETNGSWSNPAGGWSVEAPADCPIAGPCWPDVVCATESHLVLSSPLTIYDVNSDTWYGPLNVSLGSWTSTPLATSQGMIWGTSDSGLTCLAVDDAIAYAKSVGRAMTTAEYRRRRAQFIDAAEPLERAKFALAMRQFDRAKTAFQQVLDADPRQPEALLLMGVLHEHSCLDQPDEAIKYYRRAAALENNPDASYPAMYEWALVLKDRRQWKEVVNLCERISALPGTER